MRRSICLGALTVCAALLPLSQASAQQKYCQPYWTAAYKCLQGCGPCPGGGGGDVYVAPPVNPFTLHLQRFQSVIAQAQRFVDNRERTPSNDEDLSRQLATLYDRVFDIVASARLREAQANARIEAVAPALAALEADSDRTYLDYQDRIVPELERAQARAATLAQQLKAAKAIHDQIRDAQHYFEGWARAQKTSIGRWITVVLPSSPQVNAWGPPFIPMALRGLPVQPALAELPPLAAPLPHASLLPPPALKTFNKAVKPLLAGTLDERLTTVEQVAQQLAPATAGADQADATLRAQLNRHAEYSSILENTRDKTNKDFVATNTAQREARSTEHALAGVKAETKALTGYLLADAAEQYAWSNLRKYVVVPQLKRMVSAAYAGKPPYELTDEFVDQSWPSGKLHLFSLLDNAETYRNAKELLTRLDNLLERSEAGMLDAARLNAMGSPADAAAYGQVFSEHVDGDARSLARQSLTTADIPQPYREFMMKILVP